jgi:hypothetical protein
MGAVTVGGGVVGNATAPFLISAVAMADVPPGGTDFAIDRLKVGGSVAYANILAGFNETACPTTPMPALGQ